MRRDLTLMASLLLFASLASGCIDGAADPIDDVVDTVSEVAGLDREAPRPIAVEVEAVRGLETTWKVDVQATPEGGFTAVHWTLPAGALLEDPDHEGLKVAWLEVAPVFGATPPSEWGLMAIRVEEHESLATALVIDTPMVKQWEDLSHSDRHTHEVRGDPVAVPIDRNHDGRGADEGDFYVLVAMAKAPTTTRFELMFRALPEDPRFSDRHPAESTGDFRERMQGEAQALPEARRGTGFLFAEYADFGSLGMRGTYTNGQVSVKEQQPGELRPLVRDVTASTSFKPSGHTFALAAYMGAATAGKWSITGDLHGTPVKADGTLLGGIYMADTTGVPLLFAETEGEGGAALELRAQRHGPESEHLLMLQFSLGATFTQLTGVPSAEHAFLQDGGLDLPLAGARLGASVVGGGNAPLVSLVGQRL